MLHGSIQTSNPFPGKPCPAPGGRVCLAAIEVLPVFVMFLSFLALDCRSHKRGSMMNRMSFSETVFLFFLALVIFGPKKLPEIARQAGKLLAEFRRASNEFKAQIEQEIAHLEVEERKKTILPPASPPEGTASRTLQAAPIEAAAQQTVPAESVAAESPSANENATLAAPPAEPGNHAPSAEAATEAIPAEPITSTTSQESHA
jgi:sec-independent protein translocase protein TatB